jgi:hypothetical protein
LEKRLRADVSKRFVTFQYLSDDLGGGTKPYITLALLDCISFLEFIIFRALARRPLPLLIGVGSGSEELFQSQ